ncbi:flavin reductase family protein [Nesterenkonia muleiensis]|uniref:flavin reductase family protein n=1 Tax=Nesterenkonia muleiensis TaxID=2282648 RepID=UPI001EE44F34|nr:flavin reductase family protein [Nesterenkonia muleiensis]
MNPESEDSRGFSEDSQGRHRMRTVPGGVSSVTNDPVALRTAFSAFPSGIAALCAQVNGEPAGFVVTSFAVGASFEPPMVMFSVQDSSRTWPMLRTAQRIGASVLSSEHQIACRQLSSRTRDRFAGLEFTVTAQDALLLNDSPMWLECEVLSETPAGDHRVVVMRVRGLDTRPDIQPLIYRAHRFHRLAI